MARPGNTTDPVILRAIEDAKKRQARTPDTTGGDALAAAFDAERASELRMPPVVVKPPGPKADFRGVTSGRSTTAPAPPPYNPIFDAPGPNPSALAVALGQQLPKTSITPLGPASADYDEELLAGMAQGGRDVGFRTASQMAHLTESYAPGARKIGQRVMPTHYLDAALRKHGTLPEKMAPVAQARISEGQQAAEQEYEAGRNPEVPRNATVGRVAANLLGTGALYVAGGATLGPALGMGTTATAIGSTVPVNLLMSADPEQSSAKFFSDILAKKSPEASALLNRMAHNKLGAFAVEEALDIAGVGAFAGISRGVKAATRPGLSTLEMHGVSAADKMPEAAAKTSLLAKALSPERTMEMGGNLASGQISRLGGFPRGVESRSLPEGVRMLGVGMPETVPQGPWPSGAPQGPLTAQQQTARGSREMLSQIVAEQRNPARQVVEQANVVNQQKAAAEQAPIIQAQREAAEAERAQRLDYAWERASAGRVSREEALEMPATQLAGLASDIEAGERAAANAILGPENGPRYSAAIERLSNPKGMSAREKAKLQATIDNLESQLPPEELAILRGEGMEDVLSPGELRHLSDEKLAKEAREAAEREAAKPKPQPERRNLTEEGRALREAYDKVAEEIRNEPNARRADILEAARARLAEERAAVSAPAPVEPAPAATAAPARKPVKAVVKTETEGTGKSKTTRYSVYRDGEFVSAHGRKADAERARDAILKENREIQAPPGGVVNNGEGFAVAADDGALIGVYTKKKEAEAALAAVRAGERPRPPKFASMSDTDLIDRAETVFNRAELARDPNAPPGGYPFQKDDKELGELVAELEARGISTDSFDGTPEGFETMRERAIERGPDAGDTSFDFGPESAPEPAAAPRPVEWEFGPDGTAQPVIRSEPAPVEAPRPPEPAANPPKTTEQMRAEGRRIMETLNVSQKTVTNRRLGGRMKEFSVTAAGGRVLVKDGDQAVVKRALPKIQEIADRYNLHDKGRLDEIPKEARDEIEAALAEARANKGKPLAATEPAPATPLDRMADPVTVNGRKVWRNTRYVDGQPVHTDYATQADALAARAREEVQEARQAKGEPPFEFSETAPVPVAAAPAEEAIKVKLSNSVLEALGLDDPVLLKGVGLTLDGNNLSGNRKAIQDVLEQAEALATSGHGEPRHARAAARATEKIRAALAKNSAVAGGMGERAAVGGAAGAIAGEGVEDENDHRKIPPWLAGAAIVGAAAAISPALGKKAARKVSQYASNPAYKAVVSQISFSPRDIPKAPWGTQVQRLYQKLFNEYHAVEKFGKEIGFTPELAWASSQARGWVGSATSRIQQELRPLMIAIRNDPDVTLEDVAALVASERALELDATNLFGEKMAKATLQEHQDVVNTLGQNHAVGRYADELRNIYRRMLDDRLDNGLINQDQYDAIVKAGTYYIPFVRESEGTRAPAGIFGSSGGKGYNKSPGVRKWRNREGSERAIVDPFRMVINDAFSTARDIGRQRIFNIVSNIVEMDPKAAEPFIKKAPPPTKVSKPLESGRYISANVNGRRQWYEVVDDDLYDALSAINPEAQSIASRFLEWGKKGLQYGVTTMPAFQIANAIRDTMFTALTAPTTRASMALSATGGLAGAGYGALTGEDTEDRALRSVAFGGAGAGMGHLAPHIARTLEAMRGIFTPSEAATAGGIIGGTTGFMQGDTPEGENWVNDLGRRTLNAAIGAGIGAGAGRLGMKVSDRFGGQAARDAYHEWMREGGAGSGWFPRGQKEAAILARQLEHDGVHAADIINPRTWWESVQMVGRAIEEAPRLSRYKSALREGASIPEAINRSRDLSVDFSRRGGSPGVKRAGKWAAFWNPKIQGMDKMARMLDPRKTEGKKAWAIGTAAITAPSLALWSINRDNPHYQARPQYEKALYWHIPKWTGPEDGDGNPLEFWKVPKPFEVGFIFASIPESVANWYYTKYAKNDPIAGKKLEDALGQMGKNVGQGLIPIPTMGAPVLENLTNYSFFRGRALVPDRLRRRPTTEQFDNRTSLLSIALAQGAGEANAALRRSGLPDYVPEISPIKMDNFIRGTTGTMGEIAMRGSTDLGRWAGIDQRPIDPNENRSQFSRFSTRDNTMTDDAAQLLDRIRKSEQAYAAVSQIAKDEGDDSPTVRKLGKRYENDLIFYARTHKAQGGDLAEDLKNFEVVTQGRKEIINSRLPVAEKKRLLATLRQREQEIAQKIIRATEGQ